MDLRPQGDDIIRTWLFSTVLRSHFEHNSLPWQHAAISGWILDPDRKKMSKSKGNVVTPMSLLERHGSDASYTGRLAVGLVPSRAMLAELAAVVDDATSSFEGYDYARALERTERFFWTFCDDYVQLVKSVRTVSTASRGRTRRELR